MFSVVATKCWVGCIAWLDLFRVILLPTFLHLRSCLLKNIAAEAMLDLSFRNFVVAFRMTNNVIIHYIPGDSFQLDMISLVENPRIITIPRRGQADGFNDQAILAHVFLGFAASSLISGYGNPLMVG